jgi:hypothetical protein
MNLAIKLNSNITPEPCPLCGQATNPNIGAELTLADCDLVVCRDCGRKHAPALAALLELAWLALDFTLCERDFGDLWRASNEVSNTPRGLNWNNYLRDAHDEAA